MIPNNSRKLKLSSLWILPIMGIVWLVALLYISGIGQTYDVYGKAKLLVIALFLLQTIIHSRRKLSVKKAAAPVAILAILFLTVLVTWLRFNQSMLDYLWLYLLIPLLASLPVEEKPMLWVSILYGGLGMAVLFVRNFGTAFDKWNENTLAIIAFFSFVVMITAINKVKNIFVFLFLSSYFVIYYLWSEPLHSRSGVLFSLILLLGVLGVIPFRTWLKKRSVVLLLLLIPLLIAILEATLSSADILYDLDHWSRQVFGKPLFNGRDNLAKAGFTRWWQHPIFGNGNLSTESWHNSAVTMLVGGGAVGFLIWIFSTASFLQKGVAFLQDKIVFGLMLGFLVIWLHQTVELGLVAAQANAIPYAMLGLLFGRINTIRKQNGIPKLPQR